MDARTKRTIRQAHATRLSRRALAEYPRGARARVAGALHISGTRLSHLTTSEEHPVLREAFLLLLDVAAVDETTARGFAQAVQDAVELRPIIEAPTRILQARRSYLRDREHDLEAQENRASMTGQNYPDALRREAEAQLELARIEEELALRPRRVA